MLKGGNHQLFSDTPSEKELAACMKCPYGTTKFNGGGKKGEHIAKISMTKNNKKIVADVFMHNDKSFTLKINNSSSELDANKHYESIGNLKRALKDYKIVNYDILRK